MWDKFKIQPIASKKHTLPALFLGLSLFVSNSAYALDANDVLNKMSTKEQTTFIAGAIGGLAYSRYLRDKPKKEGMKCIYDWYYGSGEKKWHQIEAWFSRHPEKPAIPLLYVLVKRKCGK